MAEPKIQTPLYKRDRDRLAAKVTRLEGELTEARQLAHTEAEQRALAEVRLARGLWALRGLMLAVRKGIQVTTDDPLQSGQKEGDDD